MQIELKIREILEAIADIAFVESDVVAERKSAHELHQLIDICEAANLPETLRRLRVGLAELREALHGSARIAGDAEAADAVVTVQLSADAPLWFGEALRPLAEDYLICGVLAGWLGTMLPERAKTWNERREQAHTALQRLARSAARTRIPSPLTRASSPF